MFLMTEIPRSCLRTNTPMRISAIPAMLVPVRASPRKKNERMAVNAGPKMRRGLETESGR